MGTKEFKAQTIKNIFIEKEITTDENRKIN
jgi:hypothetical protein